MTTEKQAMTHRVFVYGTLKKNYGNNYLLRDSFFAGNAATPPNYRMVSGGYPVIMQAANGDGKSVAGELYHVDDEVLERLDRLEGVDRGMYDRKVIDVTENGKAVQAYIYVGGECTPSWMEPYDTLNDAGQIEWERERMF